MRIVQLSDIHLSSSNLVDLQNYYSEALLKDLSLFQSQNPIDVVLFTGDLLDKGGESLGSQPYRVFQESIINPIAATLSLPTSRVLFIPGNHDINRSKINEREEFFLAEKLNKETANAELVLMRDTFTESNKRLEEFKQFEKIYHKSSPLYVYSNNESLVIIDQAGMKIGFALINDSWRCSTNLTTEQHYIGYNQLFNAKRHFLINNTSMNVAIFHHPLESFNETEREEIENILRSQDFDVALFGHSHKHSAGKIISSIGGYLSLNGRAAFNEPKEALSRYQPGYSILDIDVFERKYKIQARKFIRTSGYRFDRDTESLPGGEEDGSLPEKNNLFSLANRSNNEDVRLPNSYTADVRRIVGLLIGKSIYPDKYIFIRELVQNSVDACNRIRERHTTLSPKIRININTDTNYIEVVDEGDGMSKSTIKNHFAVIGKSISQEFNDSTGHFNLISQFGIGFISTFIAAEKVVINTKSTEDGQVMFEIEDVFKGFNYVPPGSDVLASSGTSIRVYLKKGFYASSCFEHVRAYCRHIEQMEIYLDSSRIDLPESWNTEDCVYEYNLNNPMFEFKIGIALSSKTIMASNSGFLISNGPSHIIPYRFPYIIGGEINFKPGGIDFDVSRTNVISSPKSISCRREISVSLRRLIRQVLESTDFPMIQSVVNYLHFYLKSYEGNYAKMEESYSDFYSKKELILLCADYTLVMYKGSYKQLSSIILALRHSNLCMIYIAPRGSINDYQSVVIEYLESRGNLVVKNSSMNVAFREGSETLEMQNILQIICSDYNIETVEIDNVHASILQDMKLNKDQFPQQLRYHISQVEQEHNITVEIGKFDKTKKPAIRNGNMIFINHEHEAFQSFLSKVEHGNSDLLRIYLLGMLGLRMS